MGIEYSRASEWMELQVQGDTRKIDSEFMEGLAVLATRRELQITCQHRAGLNRIMHPRSQDFQKLNENIWGGETAKNALESRESQRKNRKWMWMDDLGKRRWVEGRKAKRGENATWSARTCLEEGALLSSSSRSGIRKKSLEYIAQHSWSSSHSTVDRSLKRARQAEAPPRLRTGAAETRSTKWLYWGSRGYSRLEAISLYRSHKLNAASK
ncbi:hypothetical protein DFH09DRAFT_1286257 [Mycena vulgaris]|nr:hypothetical protein DFH09DRAFT_1286257 [Mycena vulgaris]